MEHQAQLIPPSRCQVVLMGLACMRHEHTCAAVSTALKCCARASDLVSHPCRLVSEARRRNINRVMLRRAAAEGTTTEPLLYNVKSVRTEKRSVEIDEACATCTPSAAVSTASLLPNFSSASPRAWPHAHTEYPNTLPSIQAMRSAPAPPPSLTLLLHPCGGEHT